MAMDQLCKALIDTACFLDLSGDSLIDPDAAVQALEDMATTLQQATAEEIDAFVAACRVEAEHLASDVNYSDRAEYIQALPKHLGLANEDA